MRRFLKVVAVLVLVVVLLLGAALAGLYFGYFAYPGDPSPGGYSFDLDEVRRLADSMPGDKPTEIRAETVAAFEWPQLLTMAGGSLRTVRMGCFAYQLVTPSGHYIIDTAMDSEMASTMPNTHFYQIAYERMQAAISNADLIAITHEHLDHLGGITRNPDVKSLHAALRLTHEQISDPERHDNPRFPEGALDGYEPLQYDVMTAIAPGVVLIEAPGHTHGSQMVFVEMADGREVLFLGDVAWIWSNVAEGTPRPRFVSELVLPGGEDRPLVLSELRFLRRLAESEPGIVQVPGHDMNVMRELLKTGVMKPMFTEKGAAPVVEAEPVETEAVEPVPLEESDVVAPNAPDEEGVELQPDPGEVPVQRTEV